MLQVYDALWITSNVGMQHVSVNLERAVPDPMSGHVDQKRAFRREHRDAGMASGQQIADSAIDPFTRIRTADKLRMHRVVQRRTAAG
ncbi:MAG: hypothetical protein JO103_03275 [Candidatus Eremiobacteraeota bacterium]|nr:hypothetical protein [Candidatus Eremiobacteraeota bacterium]